MRRSDGEVGIRGWGIEWRIPADEDTALLPDYITPCHYTQYDSRNEDELTKLCECVMGDG
jgi:hypothetical protein